MMILSTSMPLNRPVLIEQLEKSGVYTSKPGPYFVKTPVKNDPDTIPISVISNYKIRR